MYGFGRYALYLNGEVIHESERGDFVGYKDEVRFFVGPAKRRNPPTLRVAPVEPYAVLSVHLNVTMDAEEVSWAVVFHGLGDHGGHVVHLGHAGGDRVELYECGHFIFIIWDAGNDGFGSYTAEVDGVEVASGNALTESETTHFEVPC